MLDLSPGQLLQASGQPVRVVKQHDLESLLVEDVSTGRLREVAIGDLSVLPSLEALPTPALDQERQEEAQHRFSLIAPLIHLRPRPRSAVEDRAREVGTSATTLYRLLERFENSLSVDVLARRSRSDMGASRMDSAVLEVMDTLIQSQYLTRQQRSIQKIFLAIVDRCHQLDLTPPSRDTVARRIHKITPRERVRRRQGKSAAEVLRPLRSAFPGALAPLDVVQIDHTELDIMLVDEFERLEIGRPFITVAIDVYSRAVVGFYISRDAPSFMSAGSCLAQAILPKDTALAPRQQRLGAMFAEMEHQEGDDPLPKLRWPIWGRPTKVHVDNGREFRGKMLERSCLLYGIHVELRPVKTPQYGAHIERLMGTIATELHDLPGTTFSNSQRRGDYQSQKRAVLTFDELDLWLTLFFAGIYNQRPHRGLNGDTPLAVFQRGLLEGTPGTPPKGLFPIPTPEEALKLRIDFLPSFEVTIQRYGIRLETITYYHEVLESLLARKTLGKPSEPVIVRRDPRDVSQIYLFNADAGRYYAIPFADASWHRLSVWELRELKARVRRKPGERLKELELIREQRAMKRLVDTSIKETRDTRRQREKKRSHHDVVPLMTPEPSASVSPARSAEEDEVIVPFSVNH